MTRRTSFEIGQLDDEKRLENDINKSNWFNISSGVEPL
jgi:hypothetical protein